MASLQVVRGQLPVSRLDHVRPAGGQAGQTIEVTLGGEHLDQAARLHFSHQGITAEPVRPPDPAASGPVPFRVRIDSSVPPGMYEVRVEGRFGLSNPRRFVVGVDPEVEEASSNHAAEEAQEIQLREVIHGTTEGQKIDYFRIHLQQGQEVTVECLAEEIDSQLEPVLAIYDMQRRELARQRQGGRLEFRAPGAADYLLTVHDILFEGGANHFYRLTVDDRPRVAFVMPPCVEPGRKANLTLYGRRLPGGKVAPEQRWLGLALEQVEVAVEVPSLEAFEAAPAASGNDQPAALGLRQWTWHWSPEGERPIPVTLDLALAPVEREAEPNDAPATAQVIFPPTEVAGQLYPRRDRDWFQFDAVSGSVFWVEVVAARRGAPVNPFLLLQRVVTEEDGSERVQDVKELYDIDTNLGAHDFDTRSGDVTWRFEVGATGRYRMLVRDLFAHAEPSPAHLYRLVLREAAPSFELAVVPVQPLPDPKQRRLMPWPMALRRGETWPLRVILRRQDGFHAPVEVRLEGLPEGLTSRPVRIPSGQTFAWLYLTAARDAASWAGDVHVVGTPSSDARSPSREALAGTVVWTVGDYNNQRVLSRLSSQFALSVIGEEPAPVRIGTGREQPLEAVAATSLEVPLLIEWHGDFKGPLKLKAVGHPKLSKLNELEVKEKQTEATLTLDLADLRLEPGRHEFALFGAIKGKYRNQPEVAEQTKQAAAEAAEAVAEAKEELQQAEIRVREAQAKADQSRATTTESRKKLETASEAAKAAAQEKVTQAEAADREAAKMLERTQAALQAATTRLAEATARQQSTEQRAKAAEERAKPRDATLPLYSEPIVLKVLPKPANKNP